VSLKRRAIDVEPKEDNRFDFDAQAQAQAPAPPAQRFQPSEPFTTRRLQTHTSFRPRKGQGRRSKTRSERRGHYVRAISPPRYEKHAIKDLALDATLRAAAPYQRARERVPGQALELRPWDVRLKERRRRIGNLILFVVDASGSMAAKRRMEAVKGAVLSLLLDAYQKRDRVGMIAFRGKQAELLLPPTNSIDLAERALRKMPTGGRTPLAHALTLTYQTLRKAARGDEQLIPLLVLVSDGRMNVGLAGNARQDTQQAAASLAKQGVASLVLDSEQGYVRLGLAKQVARWLNGEYLKLDALHANAVQGAVTMMIG